MMKLVSDIGINGKHSITEVDYVKLKNLFKEIQIDSLLISLCFKIQVF